MKLPVVLFALNASVWLAVSMPVSAQCHYRESSVDVGALEDASNSAKIDLQAIVPADGARIDRNTVLEVDVEFHIPDFAPGKVFLMPRFPTTYGTMGPGTRGDTPILRSANGRAHLCVPLAEVFDDPAVRWPLTFAVSVNQIQVDGSSRPVIETKTIAFSAFDLPDGKDARRAATPPEEYVHALMKAFGFLESQRVLNTVCGGHFPEMQETFARVYPPWQTRHAATINLVNALQLEQFKLQGKYPDDVARQILESVRATLARELEKVPETALRETCRTAAIELGDQDFDINGSIGNELRIVRKWQASQTPIPP